MKLGLTWEVLINLKIATILLTSTKYMRYEVNGVCSNSIGCKIARVVGPKKLQFQVNLFKSGYYMKTAAQFKSV